MQLPELVSRRTLLDLAGPLVYDRGVDYADEGRVEVIDLLPARVTAEVSGAAVYEVALLARGGRLAWSCTCPYAEDGALCKHAVALAVECFPAASAPSAGADAVVGAAGALLGDHDMRERLLRLPSARLVELLLAEADRQPAFHARLVAEVSGGSLDVTPFARRLEDVLEPDGFLSYREVAGFASHAGAAIDELRDLLAEGQPLAVIALCEQALLLLERALAAADDSDGYLGGLLDDVQALHLEACEAASDDLEPVDLAERLFAWELHGDWEVFHAAGRTYARVLGDAGLARYRELAQREWAAGASGYRITVMMEALARNLDERVAVLSRDLSSPYRYLQVASACDEAGDDEQAVGWAERGLAAFGTDARLADFLAERYQRHGRHDEALALLWAELERRPVLERYQPLLSAAAAAGVAASWRGRALVLLRAGADRSEVVRALLWEEDVEAAWAEAVDGGCAVSLWRRLADARAEVAPAASAEIYLGQLDAVIAGTNKRAYAGAVDLLHRARRCLAAAGDVQRFDAAVADVRTRHKQKRNLMALLDRAGW